MTLKPGPVRLRDFQHEAERLGFEASRNQLCWWCLVRPATTRDHFTPYKHLTGMNRRCGSPRLKAAFKTEGANLIPCCSTCNSRKGMMLLIKWIPRLMCQHDFTPATADGKSRRSGRFLCSKCGTQLRLEIEREDDGRWIAAVPAMSGVMAYGETREEACIATLALVADVECSRRREGRG